MSDFELIITHGAGTLTLTNANAQFSGDGPEYVRDENYPARVSFTFLNGTESTTNILNSSYAGWSSGTGALAIGDRVAYSVYPTATGTKTQIFYGKVFEISLGKSEREIVVNCREDWEEYEHQKVDTIYFTSYRDLYSRTIGVDDDGYVTVTGLTDANIITPFTHLQIVGNDGEIVSGTRSNQYNLTSVAANLRLASSFKADKNQLLGVVMKINCHGSWGEHDIILSICEDNGGVPGTAMRSATIYSGSFDRDGIEHDKNFTMLSSSVPLEMEIGRRYWILLEATGSTEAYGGYIATTNEANGYDDFLYGGTGGSWNTYSGEHLYFVLYDAMKEFQEVSKARFDDSTNILTLGECTVRPFPLQDDFSPYRAYVSYYYGLYDVHDILSALTSMGSLTPSVDGTKFLKQVGLYRTRDKSIAECMRELCELRETWGAWDSSQHVMAQSLGAAWLNFKRRLNLNASSAFTFSHGFDTSTDSEKRIIDGSVQLNKTFKMKPTWVKAVGRGTDGLPIVAVVHDKEIASPFSTTLGFDYMETIQDDSIQTVTDARNVAKAYLESVKDSYNAWEGRITVSGVYPDLFDLGTDSDTFGSGQIITLNYSPLGISATKFKVTGIRLLKNRTEIQLTSQDILLNNRFLDTAWTTERNESFQSPTDPQTNVLATGHSSTIWSYTPRYAALRTGVVASTSYVPVQTVTDTNLNLVFVHVEFEAGDGVTTSSAIDNLYVSDNDGHYLQVTLDNAIWKWKTTRAVVDVSIQYS